jgi:purine-binding chemotaxis protein CheW
MGVMDDLGARVALRPREYLSFRLDAEEYGIDILKVQEIRGYDTVTRIAGAPPHVRGVINLRGTVVPIVDLRMKFELGPARPGAFPVAIILNLSGGVVGVLVDSVSDVVELEPAQIKPVPSIGSTLGPDFITGLGSIGAADDARMLVLLDIERLLSGDALVRAGATVA